MPPRAARAASAALPAALALALFLSTPAPPPPAGPASYAVQGIGAPDAPGPSPAPSDWAWLRRHWPHGRADADAFRAATDRARQLRQAAPLRRALPFPVDEAGPENIGGRISDIEWNPVDPGVLYAGSATGGVFKSTDTGATWFPVADDLPNLNVGDLALDPSSPDVVWLGTGEANGGHNNFPGGGVYRSVDAGGNWTFMGLGDAVSVGRILVDPTDGQRVFVAAQGSYFGPAGDQRGLWRSTDGGGSWQRVLAVSDSAGVTDVVMQAGNPSNMLAASWERVRRPNDSHLYGPGSGIWRSTDGGNSWAKLGAPQGLPNPATQNIGRIGLAVCPNDPMVAYALITDGGFPIGLWRSDDFGLSWTNRDTGGVLNGEAFGFSWYFAQVRVSPDDCDQVFALDVAFLRSDDGGTTWPIRYGYSTTPANLHVDHHALAFHPDQPATFFEGNDGGLNRSDDRGVSFTKVARLPNIQFYEIGLDRLQPQRLYGGTQDNGTLRTTTGAVDDWTRINGGDGFYVNVDPTNSNVIYAESQYGNLRKSTNGGLGFSTVTPPLPQGERTNWSTPVVLDPSDPQVVYYGSQRLWRSSDGAASWTAVSTDLTDWVPGKRLGTLTTIDVSPADPDVVWVGTDDGNLWRGVWGGSAFSWTNVVRPNLPRRWVTRVVAHPTDPLAAWATFNGLKWIEDEGHIFHTTDAGASWTDVSTALPDIPVNALAVDPDNPDFLYAGTDLGLYWSSDNGAHWDYLSADLPLVSVYDLEIHPVARYLAIGTHGRSMYTMPLSATAVDEPPVVAGAALEQNVPNPFNPRTTIAFRLDAAGPLRLAVYDMRGREVAVLADGPWPAGRHELRWDGTDRDGRAVASGNYHYRLDRPGHETLSRSMVLLR